MTRYFFAICLSFSFLPRLCQGGWTEPVFVDFTHPLSPPILQGIEARNDSIYIIHEFHTFLRSVDDGLSWQDRLVIQDGSHAYNDFRLQGDTLVIFFNQQDRTRFYFSTNFGESWQGPRTYDGNHGLARASADFNSSTVSICMVDVLEYPRMHLYLRNSRDFGLTWEDPQFVWTYDSFVNPLLYYYFDTPYIISTGYQVGGDYSHIKLLLTDPLNNNWTNLDSLSWLGANSDQRMAASSNGRMAIVYHDWDSWLGEQSSVYACLSSDSGLTWSLPVNLSVYDVNKFPRVAVSGDTIVVAFHGKATSGNPYYSVLLKRSFDFGQTWEPVEALGRPQSSCLHPDIEIDSGEIHLIYYSSYDDSLALYYRRWEPETDVEDEIVRPFYFSLSQNHPNPFNAATTISYSLPEPGEITISIYNLLGQRVDTVFRGECEPGEHTVVWDAADFPSGVYFARLEAGEVSESLKMVLLK